MLGAEMILKIGGGAKSESVTHLTNGANYGG